MKKGLLMVNTGNGKGKTTAALGQMLRAVGHQKRVCVIQFIKGSWTYGELFSVKRFDDLVDFHVMGKGFTFKSENLEEDIRIAREGWDLARTAMGSGEYFMVILDEFTYLMNYKFIDTADVIDVLKNKPEHLHIVITGRDAPAELKDLADLVTSMENEKHPFTDGIKAQKGVEF